MIEAVPFILIFAVIILAAAMMIMQENRRQKNKFIKRIRQSWGRKPDTACSAEEYESISHYFKNELFEPNTYWVDDITWNDCDMDRLFKSAAATMSSPGDSVLYAWLRKPSFDVKELRERERLIEFIRSDEKTREKLLLVPIHF